MISAIKLSCLSYFKITITAVSRKSQYLVILSLFRFDSCNGNISPFRDADINEMFISKRKAYYLHNKALKSLQFDAVQFT